MSTKIYDAYKYNGNLYSLFNDLKDIREKYQEDAIELLSKCETLEIDVDAEKVLLKDLINEQMGEYYLGNYLKKRMDIGYREPSNIQASVVIYPYKDDLYVHFFGISNKIIESIKGLTDYHYQNQCDMSNYNWDKEKWEDMTEERQKELEDEWDERCEIWDEILGNDTPVESGFLFEFSPSGYNMTLFCDKILKKIKEKHAEV